MKYYIIISILLITTFTSAQVHNFTMSDSRSNIYNLFSNLDDDKIIVLDFFNTTCGACQRGMSTLEAIWNENLNHGKIGYVWAIETMYRNDSAINSFAEIYETTFPMFSVIDDDSVLVDSTGYHVPYTPYYYIIFPNYKIYNVNLSDIRPLIERYLGYSSIKDAIIPDIYTFTEENSLFIKNSSNFKIQQSYLYNINGELITQGNEQIDITHIKQGIYILKIISREDKIRNIKVVF